MTETKSFLRFTIWHRLEHWTFMISFTLLGITGLAQKFSEAPISLWLFELVGGIENTRIIHHSLFPIPH